VGFEKIMLLKYGAGLFLMTKKRQPEKTV